MNKTVNKKMKYGTAALIITVAVIAVLVIANVVITALADSLMWQIDMTKEQVYELSDAAKEMLNTVSEAGKDIKIIFCTPFDKLEENTTQKLIYNLACQMDKESDFVHVEYLDIITYPKEADKYAITAATSVNQQSVIITDGSDSRVLALQAFYVFDEDTGEVFGFQGEYKFLSIMLQMTDDEKPIAYFTTGHGENTENSAMYELFESAGYEVKTIDLAYEEIDENAQVVIINGPKYDFAGIDGEVNEIKKIDDFLDGMGNLLLFCDPNTTKKLPGLLEFLEEWGIGFTDAVVKDYSDSISTDGTALVAQYTTEGTGASLHKELRNLQSPPKTIVKYSMPLETLWSERNSRYVSSVLRTTNNAEAYSTENEDTVIRKGPFDLMLISTERQLIDNEEYYNHVLVAGSSKFIDDSYINSGSYGNSDIMYSVMKAMGKTTVPCDIKLKTFDDESLDITTAQANTWTMVLVSAVPAMVCIAGVVVFIRRRHL